MELLIGKDYFLIGAGVAGFPTPFMARNSFAAWSLTLSYQVACDFYKETLSEDGNYFHNNTLEKFRPLKGRSYKG